MSNSEPRKYQYFPDRMVIESYKTMISQMFGLSITYPQFITINGVGRYLVSFDDINKMITSNEIESCDIEPSLQKWIRPEGTSNMFVTFYGKNKQIYIAKVSYDMSSGRIFPPI